MFTVFLLHFFYNEMEKKVQQIGSTKYCQDITYTKRKFSYTSVKYYILSVLTIQKIYLHTMT